MVCWGYSVSLSTWEIWCLTRRQNKANTISYIFRIFRFFPSAKLLSIYPTLESHKNPLLTPDSPRPNHSKIRSINKNFWISPLMKKYPLQTTHRCSLLLVHGKLLLLDCLQLVPEVELSRFLLQLSELVLVFWNFLQCRLDARERVFSTIQLVHLIKFFFLFEVNDEKDSFYRNLLPFVILKIFQNLILNILYRTFQNRGIEVVTEILRYY